MMMAATGIRCDSFILNEAEPLVAAQRALPLQCPIAIELRLDRRQRPLEILDAAAAPPPCSAAGHGTASVCSYALARAYAAGTRNGNVT